MNDYGHFDKLLQGRNKSSRKLANNTYAIRHNCYIAIRLHETDIVVYYPGGNIYLHSGGYRTPTTKDRINRFSPVHINQRGGLWYVHFGNGSISVFHDNMRIKNGKVLSGVRKAQAEIKRIEKLTKQINAYCDKIRNMKELPVPGAGDCWFCCMRTRYGTPLGDATGDENHLLNHLKEKYVDGSLIVNALKARGYGDPALFYQMNLRDSIVSAVRAYFKKQLHIAR